MTPPNTRLRLLWKKWLLQQLCESEIVELWALLQDPQLENEWEALLENTYNQTPDDEYFSLSEKKRLLENAVMPWNKSPVQAEPTDKTTNHDESLHDHGKPTRNKPGKIKWLHQLKLAAAVAIILIGLTYFFIETSAPSKKSILTTSHTDIYAPLTQKATLSFGNAAPSISLQDSASGLVGRSNSLRLIRQKDGRLVLKGTVNQTVQSTLSVPKGSRPIHLELPDGSQVWVNAGSSLRFPNRFSENTRRVTLQGEAYFEVAHLNGKPFLVNQGANTVRVLGTHFNINGYTDEPVVKVTLLMGKVAVNSSLTIQPGQQARIDKNKKVTLNVHPDLAEVMSWKNNEFIFDRADIPAILRQLSRWYGLEIIYKNDIPSGHYSGSISRDNKLSQILSILQSSGLKFKIQEKQLIVL